MLKKLLFTLLIVLPAMAWSQSLAIVANLSDTVSVGNASNENDLESYVIVKNISNQTIDVRVKRIDGNYNALTDSNAICWDICFQPSVSVSPPSFDKTMAPGEQSGNYDFVGHVYPDMDGVPNQGPITYVFFNANDPTDSVAHTVNYKLTANFSVEEAFLGSVNVFPNPASNRITVNYDLAGAQNGKFELVNLVGSKVFVKELSASEAKFDLNISKLSSGVYFYRLTAGGNTVKTKRLIIE